MIRSFSIYLLNNIDKQKIANNLINEIFKDFEEKNIS